MANTTTTNIRFTSLSAHRRAVSRTPGPHHNKLINRVRTLWDCHRRSSASLLNGTAIGEALPRC